MLELSQNSDYPSSKYLNELESTPPPPVQSEGYSQNLWNILKQTIYTVKPL